MPFDPVVTDPTVFVPGKEGLRRLAMLLRRYRRPGFHWDFPSILRSAYVGEPCGTFGCALGLAVLTWPEVAVASDFDGETMSFGDGEFDAVPKLFGITEAEMRTIFYGHPQGGARKNIYGKPISRVTRRDVADAIDRFLATGKVTAAD